MAATSVLMLVTTACTRVPDVVKIGVGQPLSGGLAAQGQDLLNGVQLAVEEINAEGGVTINGKKLRLEIVSADDKSNPQAGKEAAQRLVDAGVTVAIAHLNSGVSIPAAPIYAAAGIPQLAISTNPAYTRQGLPTTLRLVANDDLQSKALGSYATSIPGVQRVAVVDDSTLFGKGLADSAAQVITAGARQVTLRQSLDDRTTDFAALVESLRKSGSELVVTTQADFQVAALIEQLSKAGMSKIQVLGCDAMKTDKLLGLHGKVAAIYATSPILEPREFLAGPRFLAAFRSRFKSDPVYGAHYAYDATYVVADALARNRSTDKAALLSRLKLFDGNAPISGTMRFGADGEQRYGAVGIYKLGATQWVPLMRSDRW